MVRTTAAMQRIPKVTLTHKVTEHEKQVIVGRENTATHRL